MICIPVRCDALHTVQVGHSQAGQWKLARVFAEHDEALISRKLPKVTRPIVPINSHSLFSDVQELLLRAFSYLDVVSLCRCAQVSRAWNILALDGSNWQRVDLFEFQVKIEWLDDILRTACTVLPPGGHRGRGGGEPRQAMRRLPEAAQSERLPGCGGPCHPNLFTGAADIVGNTFSPLHNINSQHLP